MRCEIVAVGTELLLGQVVDTNSAWIGERLAAAGVDVHLQTRVGDNLERIVQALRAALDRSDAVVACGGLGPTHDDLTRDAIARLMGVPMLRDAAISERIRGRFAARGRPMPDSNLRQADVPRGASPMSEMPGTAPGLTCPIDGKVLYAVPGVPSEMRAMMDACVIPDLTRRRGAERVIRSRTLLTWGESESALAERLARRIEALERGGGTTLALLASAERGIRVRITAAAAGDRLAGTRLGEEEARLRELLGPLVFGVDDETLESVVIDALRRRGWRLGLAESLTGGLLGARLTAVPGASDVLAGGIVAYASEVKRSLLGVSPGPVVSESAAREMAAGACRVLETEVGLATTGVAGPDEQEGNPPGTVFVAIAVEGRVEAHRLTLPGDRRRVRELTVMEILNRLRLRLEAASVA